MDDSLLSSVSSAVESGKLTETSGQNIQRWLTDASYAAYAPQVAEHVRQEKWRELDDAFWTVIPFGTGGRRGAMYPIGTNAINDRTIGESAQGLADYVKSQGAGGALSCAIAYDTRHRSEHFAKLCAGVMAAAGFTVYYLNGHRSTPALSFAVRYKKCSCGIMVTASHNPPSDNAVKVYWSTGGQLLPPHDKGVIDRVMSVNQIAVRPFSEAVVEGSIVLCQEEIDEAFISAVVRQGFRGPRTLKILYSPLHGVGATAVNPALAADGFDDVETFGPHAEPDGDFPNVPGHVSNPENPAVFDAIIEDARENRADVILATDPDCDRLGCAAPLTTAKNAAWRTFTGNQIGALLAEYVLESRKKAGKLSSDHYLVKTLVTTEMIRRIGDAYGVKTYGDYMVGFKYIGGAMDEYGPDKFVIGLEESHGYLVGEYARDKDAAVAAMLLAELAARLKANGETLYRKLDALYWQYGAHAEKTVSVTLPGVEGMQKIRALMNLFRQHPPREVGGMRVVQIRDYLERTRTPAGGAPGPLDGPRGDMVMLDLEAEGTYVAVRPSGTEPKVKFYMFTYEPAEQIADLEATKAALAERLESLRQGLSALAEA
jgi:phosphoglucomutase/phosphomannomutase